MIQIVQGEIMIQTELLNDLEKELFSRSETPEKSYNKLKKYVPGVIKEIKIGNNIYNYIRVSKNIDGEFYTFLPLDIDELKKIILDTIDWKARRIADQSFNNQEKAKKFYESNQSKIKKLKKWDSLVKFITNL